MPKKLNFQNLTYYKNKQTKYLLTSYVVHILTKVVANIARNP